MANVKRKLARPKDYEDEFLVLLEREPRNPFANLNHDEQMKPHWEKFKVEVLEIYTSLNPGARPVAWWTFEAPEYKRQQLSGTNVIPLRALDHETNWRHRKGVPDAWWYRKTIDPNDPPVFESQASYLKRHCLFMEGEEDRLTKEDFEPEVIKQED